MNLRECLPGWGVGMCPASRAGVYPPPDLAINKQTWGPARAERSAVRSAAAYEQSKEVDWCFASGSPTGNPGAAFGKERKPAPEKDLRARSDRICAPNFGTALCESGTSWINSQN